MSFTSPGPAGQLEIEVPLDWRLVPDLSGACALRASPVLSPRQDERPGWGWPELLLVEIVDLPGRV